MTCPKILRAGTRPKPLLGTLRFGQPTDYRTLTVSADQVLTENPAMVGTLRALHPTGDMTVRMRQIHELKNKLQNLSV